jgi:hypothetical protein
VRYSKDHPAYVWRFDREAAPWAERDSFVNYDCRYSEYNTESGFDEQGEVIELETLVVGPPVFAVVIPTEVDCDGDMIRHRTEWHNSREDAEAALLNAPRPVIVPDSDVRS